MRKTVNYEIFDKCKEFTDDPFWQNLFDECHHGKFPRGIKFKYNQDAKAGLLSIRRPNGQSTTYEVKDDACPETVFELVQNIFKLSGITSMQDNENVKSNVESTRKESLEDKEWKKIKTKKDRQILIMNYCIAMQKQLGLTREQVQSLYKTVSNGVSSKAIDSKDITVKRGNITSIKNINFEGMQFYCVNKPKDDSTSKTTTDAINVNKLWEKCRKQVVEQNNGFTARK